MTRESKIIVSVVIVMLVAFSIVAILFIPLPDISTYNVAFSVADFKDSAGILYSLEELNEANGYGENYSNSFDSVEHFQILNTRKKLFANNLNDKITVDRYTFYSYYALDKTLDTSLEYFISLSKMIKGASRAEQRNIESISYDLRNRIGSIVDDINKVHEIQIKNLESEEDIKALSNKYLELQDDYREALTKQANLVIELNKLINKCSFDGEYCETSYSILFNSFAYAIKSAMSVSFEEENGYLLDATLIADKIESYLAGNNIFVGINERAFIFAYRDLYSEYYDGLEAMFNLPHDIKSNVVNYDDFANSNIKVEYQDKVRLVLTLIGIV